MPLTEGVAVCIATLMRSRHEQFAAPAPSSVRPRAASAERVLERRERATTLIVLSDLFPDRAHDVDHLQCATHFPLAPRAAARVRHRQLRVSCCSTPAADPTGMFGSMPPCQSAQRPLRSGVFRRDAAVFVGAHVAVGHRHRIDVPLMNASVPGARASETLLM